MSECYPLRHIDPSLPTACIARPGELVFNSSGAVVPARDTPLLRLQFLPMASSTAAARAATIALQSVSDCPRGKPDCALNKTTIATWTGVKETEFYRQPLAVSPDGHRVATIPSSHIQMGPGYSGRSSSDARFSALRTVGELMLVDLQTGAVRDAGFEVGGDEPISWSADGKRLLFVRVEPVDRLPPRLAREVVPDDYPAGQGVPIVETWEVASGATEMLAIGLQPFWSPDNRTLLYQPAHDRVATLDLSKGTDPATQVSRPVVLPGMSTRYEPIAIAFVAPRKVLYWALPTNGVEPQFTMRNSPLVGPKQMLSLKVVDLDSGAFATVYPSIDPRWKVGYRGD